MIRYSQIGRLGLQITFRKEFSLMKLTQLEYFCAAVECQSITAAAKKLYVTQPAISGAIRELEKEFSVTLFSHARNKMALTEDGRLFYERVEQLLREVESTAQELHDLGSAQQTVRWASRLCGELPSFRICCMTSMPCTQTSDWYSMNTAPPGRRRW